jgi:hypothetical protein
MFCHEISIPVIFNEMLGAALTRAAEAAIANKAERTAKENILGGTGVIIGHLEIFYTTGSKAFARTWLKEPCALRQKEACEALERTIAVQLGAIESRALEANSL